jgi:hypothetical protein
MWKSYTESVLDIWLVWGAALAMLLLVTWRLSARWPAPSAISLWRHERGAAYTLSVTILLPVYIVIIGTVIECSLMLVVKMGSMHAAFAAARAASVWLPAEVSDEKRLLMIHWAAAQGIAPYASSREPHLVGIEPAWSDLADDNAQYEAAINSLSDVPMPSGYMAKKRRYALSATRLQITVDEWRSERQIASPDGRVVVEYVGRKRETEDVASHAPITVTLTYEKPIDLPGVGVFLGHIASWTGSRCYTREISTTVTLEKEGPKSRNQTLGIHYDSWDY